MGCCCNNKENIRSDPSIPDDIDPCCNIRGKRCMCLPYDDGLVIAAQILAILALFFSWIWWGTFLINIGGLVMFQLPWCCRQNSGAIYGSAALAVFNALIMMGLGIYVAVVWGDMTDCRPFDGYTYKSTSPYYNSDYCREEAWATVACVCAALWAAAALCMFLFVKSGRHAKWEKHHTPSEVELAEASPEAVEVAEASPETVEQGGVAVLETPQIKVDDV